MTDREQSTGIAVDSAEVKHARKRYRAERRFRMYGVAAIAAAAGMLALLVISIVATGWTAFYQHSIALDVTFEAKVIDPKGGRDPSVLARADYRKLARASLRKLFPDVKKRGDKRKLYGLLSIGVDQQLAELVAADPSLIGQTRRVEIYASDDVDSFLKGFIDREAPESDRRIKDKEIAWLDKLETDGAITSHLNLRFWTKGDSREPELAGFWGAMVGSFFTLLVTLALSFPVGVLAATYLEEFAPKNRWTDIIEVNINNLAAVPSIVFGLLGLAVFLNFFGLPRSAPLVGGMVLALMTLPTIIIASRSALKAVPPSIREAAFGVGASELQVVTHHVVPLALPGILTGAIIGMARALGETAPLLMIGMVAFIVDIPGSVTDPATVMPVQIYLWADSPERAFVARTSAGVMALLGFLMLMNALAVILRKRFERRW
ncbi:MAG: phosphate ABC transporter permease PstA [Alphaproteobacteria bacterium]|jgi:phosphate transport system permease protein|nr:phosphate ABC transporter permease PstA [Alphaproteobacteria bacterium]